MAQEGSAHQGTRAEESRTITVTICVGKAHESVFVFPIVTIFTEVTEPYYNWLEQLNNEAFFL